MTKIHNFLSPEERTFLARHFPEKLRGGPAACPFDDWLHQAYRATGKARPRQLEVAEKAGYDTDRGLRMQIPGLRWADVHRHMRDCQR